MAAIDDYIQSLPEEERRLYSDLIEEHRRRDAWLNDVFTSAREDASLLFTAAANMCQTIQRVSKEYEHLKKEAYACAVRVLEDPVGRYQ